MPIAELLGVQFDMQLLGKLSVSVAAVLFISWAFRFYTSRTRATRKPPLHDPAALARPSHEPESPQNGTCRNCKAALRHQSAPSDTGDEGKQSEASPVCAGSDDLTPEDTSALTGEGQLAQMVNSPGLTNTGKMAESQDRIHAEEHKNPEAPHPPFHLQETETNKSSDSDQDTDDGSTLKLPGHTDSRAASPSGRKSPCFLQRLEGCVGVGVGRELRQNLDLQGAHSCFLSKAEITVEDAHLVLEGRDDQSVVRGKIYEYYVESSSVTEATPGMARQRRGSQGSRGLLDSPSGEFGSRGSSLSEPPPSLSPIVMRDLVLTQNVSESEDLFSPSSPEPGHTNRPVLLRKDSYLSAAELSELHIPTPAPRTSTPLKPSQGPHSGDSSPASPLSPTTTTSDPNTWEEPSLETVAGARFLHPPTESSSEKESSMAGRLDLGNCMEVLALAKKHGQDHLRQAALRVMSDNYFQVLRDPGLYGRLMAGERDQVQRLRTRGRRFLVAADMDPQDWGRSDGSRGFGADQRTSSRLYYYDDYQDSWHQLCQTPQEVVSKGCAMCTMDNYLFVALGCQGTDREMKPSKRVFCYNPVTSIWKEISPMNEARPHCKLAALQGHVYAIGGECLSTVERYDPRSDRWTFVAPLPNDTFAVAHRVTVCNEELFVSGGTLRYTLLRYNPRTNAWRRSLIVGTKERTTEMVAVRSFLYRFDVNPVLGISVYRYHMGARLWYECSSKRMLHCPAFQCVAVDDTIYCLSRQFTMRFLADETSPAFIADDLSVLAEAKGVLFPVVLSLPEKRTLQTSV
ncbi:kelch domain-containing protein 7A [Hypomesus transpacificus]|uniref:kelch domain-containing protein 7A n=1 Tax=Hypomesus transpacificus TaxID=137520 RepID=UPI001F07A624|nr:kelch domain-containing protein 7A [Hypomesus transpacificus]